MEITKKISCKNCSAELLFDPNTQMSNCNFCGTQFEIETAEDTEIDIKPDGLIPFSFDKIAFKNAVLTWLSEGDYTPDDILTTSVFDDVNGLYLPLYFYTGKYSGNWSASSGYDRREEYIEWDSINKKNVRRTRTVTDWRPSNGQVSGPYSILGYAGETENLPSSIMPFMQQATFNKGQVKPFKQQYLSGYNILPFSSDSDTIWDSQGAGMAEAIGNADIVKRVPGDRHKDLYSDLSYEHKDILNIFHPAYIVHYDYNGNKHHTYIDGDKIGRVVGERPVDKGRQDHVHLLKKPIRIFWWSSAILTGILIGVYSSLSNYEQKSFGDFLIFFAVAITVWGIIAYVKSNKAVNAVLEESKRRRQEILSALTEGKPIPTFEQKEPEKEPEKEPKKN